MLALPGIAGLLVVTVGIAAYLLHRLLGSLEPSLAVDPRVGEEANVAMRERMVVWLIGLRWIAAFAAAAVVVSAATVAGRVPPDSVFPLWLGTLTLFAFNAVLSLLGARRLSSERAFAMQVAGDVVILGWLIHHAGGFQNPFVGFFVFHAAIAAVVLRPHYARRVAVAIAVFVIGLTVLHTTGLLPARCLYDAGGSCTAIVDSMWHAASGAAVAVIVVGCAFLIVALMRVLRLERDRLASVSAALTARANELSATQVQVERERKNLQTIIDCMADAVLYVTPDGVVRLRNQAAAHFWPDSPTSHDDLRTCHSPAKWDSLLAKLADPGQAEIHPVFAVAGRTYESSYARVCDEESRLQGVVMVARDVTERTEAQNWRMQEERMAVVGKLAAGLAHELNNPLGAIALFTQHALAEIPREHPLSDHLGTVLRNAQLCTNIVHDLLEYARRRAPERCSLAVGDLFGDVVRTLEARAQSSNVRIVCQGDLEDHARLYGDPDQLRQVLVNLGLNAIEAMPEGGALTFDFHACGGEPRIEVTDTGTGIDPDELERIFSAFHTTKPEGTGLGLTVAQDIVTAHGGTIVARSDPGNGSAFTLRLPRHAEAAGVEAFP